MKEPPDVPFVHDNFPPVTWPQLEEMSRSECSCGCGNKFRADDPMELASRCHRGPVFVAYNDGWLYMSCGKCREPINRIKVEEKLI